MTNGTTIVKESPSLLRVWWKNKNLQYDVAMSSIIIILNIAAIVYMLTQKFPFSSKLGVASQVLLTLSITLYVAFGVCSCVVWFMAIEVASISELYIFGRICHTFGFCTFLILVYVISPHLTLHFGLPCLLWFVAAMIAPYCPCLWKGLCNTVRALRDWWQHVNRPQSEVVIV